MNDLISRLRTASEQMKMLGHKDWSSLAKEAAEALGAPEVNVFDECETYYNCTVEVFRNSVTGAISVGWYSNGEEA